MYLYRDNYREAKYIGGLMAVTVPVWLAWIMAAVVLNESFHQACVGELSLGRKLVTMRQR